MKFFITFALLISCAFAAVDWTAYNCASVAALGPNAFSCADWNTIPYTAVSPLAQCISQTTSCSLLSSCTFSNGLNSVITQNCVGFQTLKATTTGIAPRP